MQKIAIIGAGLAGLTLARKLQQFSREHSLNSAISLFDKSRGVSGRMATHRAHEFTFDHGAHTSQRVRQNFNKMYQKINSSPLNTEQAIY